MLTKPLRSCIAFVFVCITSLSYGQAGLTYSNSSRVGTATLGETFSLNPGETAPTDVAFNLTGNLMYVIGNGSDNVYEFYLSTPYDVSTASIQDTLSIAGQEGGATGLALNSTGTQLYIIGTVNDNVYQYNMSPFNQSSATYSGNSFSVTTEDGTPSDIAFSNDGFTMFMIGNATDNVYQYDLSAAFDITSASYSGNSFSVAGQESAPAGFTFNADGSKMLVVGTSGDRIYEYMLTTPFDITTASFSGVYFSTSADEASPEGIVLNDDGTKLIMVGAGGDSAYGYDLLNAAFVETGSNDGHVEGSLVMTLSGETFTSAGGTLTQTTDYTITNLPAGLTPTITVSADATSAQLSLSGSATDNNNSDDVTLQFTFTNSAFTGGNAGLVANAIGASSGLSINFYDSLTPGIVHSAPIDIATATYNTGVAISEDTSPTGVAFSADGMRMYVTGSTTNTVIEYTLSGSYDVATATATGEVVDMNFLDGTPTEVTFNNNGTRMYVSGTDADTIYEFYLTTGFDLSTASYTGNTFYVGGQDTAPGDLSFNRDGTKLFIVGSSADGIYEYDLSTPFDITSAVFSTSLPLPQDATAVGMEFNLDGSRLFMLGASTDRVYEYHLTTGFDLTTASYSGISYYTGGQEASPEGLTLSKDGMQFFIVGVNSDNVHAFNISNAVIQETASNDGTVEGSLILAVIGELFTNPGGTLTSGSDFSVDNLPTGLTPTMTVSADGSSATLTLTGSAVSNENADDVGDIQVTFGNSAFAGGTLAGSVNNAVSGTGGFGIDFTDGLSPEIQYHSPVEVSSATFNASIDVSTEDSAPVGMEFSPDGMRMYIVGNTSNSIIEYTLSGAFDITTASPTGITYDMAVLDGTPTDVAFNANGSRMYVSGTDSDNVFAFDLSTEYDLSTAAYSGNFFYAGTEDTGLADLAFNIDGSKMFTIGSTNDAIYEYDLSVNFDITTAVFSQSFAIGTQEPTVYSFEFNANGTELLIIGSTDRVYQYSLTAGFDLSTASYSGISYFVGGEESTPEGMALSTDGKRLFITGINSDNVHSYDLSATAFREVASNDGTVEGSLIITIQGESFANPGTTLTESTDYSFPVLYPGLTSNLQVSNDGLSATLTFSGSHTSHQDGDDGGISMTFNNSAIAGGTPVATIANAIGGSTGLMFDYNNNPVEEVTYHSPIQVSNAIVGTSFDVSGADSAPVGLVFVQDGYKMYVVGNTSNTITEYVMSPEYDLTTAVPTGATYDMTVLDGTPSDVAFNSSGSRMYVSGTEGDIIHEFYLSTEFDLSTVAYTGNSFYVGGEDAGLGDLAFNRDGSKLFTIGSANDAMYEYDLAVNYDITTAVFSQSFSIAGQEATGLAFEFNADGTHLLVVGSSNDRVYEYYLTTGFDLSTASYSGISYFVGGQESTPEALTLSEDGTKMFVTGVNSDNVWRYDLSSSVLRETAANDGTVEGRLLIGLISESFINPGGTLTSGVDYTVDNLPGGLTPTIAVGGDGLTAALYLTGSATSNDDADDVTDIQLTFANSAFAGGTAAASVFNGVGGSSNMEIDFTDNLAPKVDYASPVMVSTATYNVGFDISAEDSAPVGLVFSADGMKMYTVGNTTNRVYEYSLSFPFDVSTAISSGNSYDMTVLDGTPTDVAFNANGSRMYVSGTDSDNIFEFNLSTEYDLGTAAYTGNSFHVGTEDTSPGDLAFNSDGSKMFVIGSTNDAMYEYGLSVNYDITTATFTQSFSIGAQEATGLAFEFNADGSNLFVLGSSSDRVYEYHLTAGFDLSTASFSGISYHIGGEETSPEGFTLSRDGTQMFVTGVSSDNVHSYNLSKSVFRETAANDGVVEGSMIIKVTSEAFLNPGSNINEGSDYTVDNLPSGFIPLVDVAADGLSATLRLVGNATANDDLDDVNDIQMTFTDLAFTGGTAAASVTNAVTGSSDLVIDFNDNLSPELSFALPIEVSTANFETAYSITTEDSAPVGLVFSPDGMRMYAVGNTSNTIIEYTLSVSYDVSTAAPTGATYDMSALDGVPTDVAFNANGSRMYVSASDTDTIYEFYLSTEFDLSTAAYTGNSFYVGGEDASPGDLAFNQDGSKLFMVGSTNDAIYEYSLGTNYDITTATFTQSFGLVAQEATALAFEFNADGTEVFIVGSSTDRVYQYHLTTGFDVSTAAYSNISYYIGDMEGTPEAFTLSRDGTRMFITGVNSDNVISYAFSDIAFRETAVNDGTVEGRMIINLQSEAFVNPGGNLTESTHYTVDNMPSGLTPDVIVASDGLSATLTFTGAAVNNDDIDDVSNIQMTFTDAAFTGGNVASSITNAVAGTSGNRINFTPNITPEISYSMRGNILEAVFNTTFDASTEETSLSGFVFNNDGSRLFVSGLSNDDVYQYDLGVNYDISTATFTTSLDVQFQAGNPNDLVFSADGSRMFVVAQANGEIHEYAFQTPFDLSSASYSGNSLITNAQDGTVTGIRWSNDGMYLYTVGNTSDAVYQYALTIPYDLSTASYTGNSFAVSSQTGNPKGIDFNADGSQMIVTGNQVFSYELATNYDISTATFSGYLLDVSNEESFLENSIFADGGTKLIICGTFNGLFTSYDLPKTAFVEISGNDGSVEGEMIVSVAGDLFANAGGSLTDATDYTIDNLPVGLVPTIDVAPNGVSAKLTLTGNAVNNRHFDDVDDISITFQNSAFAGANASIITNAIGGFGGLGINFFGGVIHVSDDAVGLEDGSTWADAYTSLDDALADAISGDTIVIEAGTYYPSIEMDLDGSGGSDPRERVFYIPQQVNIFGGFDGTETVFDEATLDTRDFITNETILSGDFNDDDGYTVTQTNPGVTIFTFNLTENAYHVLYGYDLFLNVFDGITIKGGNADGTSDNAYGGGMFNESTSLYDATFNHVHFVNNSAQFGGAMFSRINNGQQRLKLNKSVFEANMAEQGAALATEGQTFGANRATIEFCQFLYNYATEMAGAIAVNVGNNSNNLAEISGTLFSNNTAVNNGGAIVFGSLLGNERAFLVNNVFYENTSDVGGAIHLLIDASPTEDLRLINNTFTLNEAATGGGAINFAGSDAAAVPDLVNNLFWNNTAASVENSWDVSSASYTVAASHNAIPEAALPAGTTDESGNQFSLAADPFTDLAAINLEPVFPSSLIDGGADYNEIFSNRNVSLDYNGDIRLRSTAVDIGAVEYASDQPLPYTNDEAEINDVTLTSSSSTLTLSDFGFIQDVADRIRFANNGSTNTFITDAVTNVYAAERLDREWYLEILDDPTIGQGGRVSFTFDLETPLDVTSEAYYLLHRSLNTDEFVALDITDVLVNGNTVEIRSGFDDLPSGYYTLGRSNDVAPGYAIALDGMNDRFSIVNTSHSESFTYELWIKTSEASPNDNGILITNLLVEPYVYVTLSTSGTISVNMTDSLANLKDYDGSIVINDNQWHHMAITNDGGNDLRIYVDGVEDTPTINQDDVLQPTNYPTSMIGGFSASFVSLQAEMDEFRLWKVARTLDEIQANISSRLTGTETDLLSYVSFDELAPSVFSADYSGNGAHLILSGVDFNGATSDWVPSGAFTLDFTPPEITIDALTTSNASPELTGTVDDPDATIDVEVDGNAYVADNNADGTWTLSAGTITPDLADGVYDVVATATDVFTNVGTDATVDELTVVSNLIALPATNVTSSSFEANWAGGLEVQEYRIDISEQADFSTFYDVYNDFSVGLATNLEVTGLEFGTDYYYRIRFTDNSSNVSEDSNEISVTTTTEQGTLDDFAALTDIYNAMDGENWTEATGWLGTRLQDWNLITLDANQRVSEVNLSNNNLSGAMPDITVGLEQLIDLNLSANAIDGIGDISNLTALTDLDVSFNHLEFDDLEPLVPMGITNFSYNDQANIQFDPETDPNFQKTVREETVRIVPHNDPYTIAVTTGGTANQYNWLVDGTPITSGADYTITDGTTDISAIDYDNMGQFSVEVTNTLLPNLTLLVDPEGVFAVVDVNMSITDFDDVALTDNISGYLLEAFRRESGFDTLERADDIASTFTFTDVILGDYLCSIDPSNRDLFIPSYFGDVFEWDLADTIFLRSTDDLIVKVTGVPTEPLEGDGVLDVVIEEDLGDDAGRIDARRRAAGRKCGLKKRRSGGRTDQEGIYDLIAYGETDENGEFQFGQLPEGVYRFFVEYPGIPLDQSSFVEFEVGEQGVSDTEFKLTAFASETGLEVSIERVLGVILDYFKNLEVYPNPADDFVNIRYRHLKSENVTGQLIDLAGNTLWSADLQHGFDGKLRIDVSGFEKGIYILRFYDRTSRNENVVSYRIIVNE